METIPLDVRTLVLMNLLVSVTLAMLAYALGERDGLLGALRSWGSGMGMVSAGLLLHGLRGPLPEIVGVLFGNGLLLIGALYAQRAARELHGAPTADPLGWLVVAAAVGGLAALHALTPDLRPRGLLFSLAAAFLMVRAGLVFHALPAGHGRARLIAAGALYCWAALHILRGIYFAGSPPWENFFASTWVSVATLVLSSLFLIATTFGVLMAVVGESQRRALPEPVAVAPSGGRPGGLLSATGQRAADSRRCILFVDDDADLRQTMSALLAHHGYETLLAGSADAAQAMLAEDGLRPDAVVLDVVVPGTLSGIGLAEGLREARPYLPVVLITGYGKLVKLPRGEFELIEKPFTVEQMLAAIDRERERVGLRATAGEAAAGVLQPGA
jgi:CheY-like chemotaxis protein